MCVVVRRKSEPRDRRAERATSAYEPRRRRKHEGPPASCHHGSDMAIADRYTFGANAVVLNGSAECCYHLEAAAALFWEVGMSCDGLKLEIWVLGEW